MANESSVKHLARFEHNCRNYTDTILSGIAGGRSSPATFAGQYITVARGFRARHQPLEHPI